jgi:hypothetical protein
MQALSFDFVVKDTPEAQTRALRSQGDVMRFDFDVLLPWAFFPLKMHVTTYFNGVSPWHLGERVRMA